MTEIDIASSLPRSVLVADDQLYRKISADPDTVELLEDLDAMIIPYSAKTEVHAQQVAVIRDVLRAAGKLIPGALLIKNPYETEGYELAELAIETFASAKYHALANVARLLGAKEVRFIEAKVERNNDKWKAAARGGKLGVNANVDASNEVTKKLEAKLEGEMKFPGSDPATDDALSYLDLRNLSHDRQLRDLVDMRTGKNLLSDYTMKLSGTRESAANFTSALKIANAGPVKAIEIGASFTKTAESISNIEITTVIVF